MDGQNQKYINCLVDGLHVITAEQRPRRGKRISEPTEETIEETKEAIYKQQSGIGILIDFFSRPTPIGPSGWEWETAQISPHYYYPGKSPSRRRD